jgi:NAD(P)-dependent dehydrogenase (short-subunit alcohol dehydrogenase family)
VVNNAGIGAFGPTESYSATQWDQVFDTNVKGIFLFCQKALPHLKAAKKGHFITIASDVANAYLMVDRFIVPLNMPNMPLKRHCARKLEKRV